MSGNLTRGFLNSLGLMHRTKKGLHWLRAVISASRLFLNCVLSVGARFRVSDPMLRSEEKICCRKRFLETWISCRRSAEKVSRFLSRKLRVS